jgi:serine/threonine-protein kinase
MTNELHLQTGQVVGNDFRIVRPLGSGGMGAVFVAEQLSTGRMRALKVIHPELMADADARRRFALEARIAARVESDHVVEVVSAGIDGDTHTAFLAMELLDGRDLREELRLLGRLSVLDALDVLGQVAHGLGAAHRAGIVHRDLKPENVFLARSRLSTQRRLVKILDFGIAKLVHDARTTTRPIGTPLYMAPEQVDSPSRVSPCTDVWAFGLLAFRALAGIDYWRAAGAGSMTQLLREILVDPLEAASARAAEQATPAVLARGFDQWFSQAVARNPANRFADATLAFEALRSLPWAEQGRTLTWADGPQIGAAPVAGTIAMTMPDSVRRPPAPQPVPGGRPLARPRPIDRWVIAGSVAVVVTVAVVLWRVVAAARTSEEPASFVPPESVASSQRATPTTETTLLPAGAIATDEPDGAAPVPGSSRPAAHVATQSAPAHRAVSRSRSPGMDAFCMAVHPGTPRGYAYDSSATADARRKAAANAGCTGGSFAGMQFCCP